MAESPAAVPTPPSTKTPPAAKALPPWPLLALLSGLLMGFSQPIVIESLTGKTPLDGSGLTGLLAFVALVPALVAVDTA